LSSKGMFSVEQVEHHADEQSAQEPEALWESLEVQAPFPQQPHSSAPSGAQRGRQRGVLPGKQGRSTSPPRSNLEASRLEAGEVLERMTRLSQRLTGAEEDEALVMALSSFLALCGTQRGLVLRAAEGVAPWQVVVCWNVPEHLVHLLADQQSLREPLPAGQAVGSERLALHGKQKAKQRTPLEEALAAARVGWYAWLPLTVEGRVRVVLVALGDGGRAQAFEEPVAQLALTLLAELTSAALNRVRLQAHLAYEARVRDDFIGLASHELKSPLTIIKGYSQLLLRKARHEGTREYADRGSLEAISQQVSRMSNLVNELLDVSRIDRGMLEVWVQPVELVALVRKVLEARQRTFPGEAIRLVKSPESLMVLADAGRVEQILGVLLENARKFGGGQEPVEVSIEQVAAETVPPVPPVPGVEAEPAVRQGQVARVAVRDYGLGLPVEERRYLFTPFYRGPESSLHRQLAGLGLGLYLSAYLVARQQGSIWAEFSTKNGLGGSIFYLSLPLLPQQ
jgi:signal transduction histidine kinase